MRLPPQRTAHITTTIKTMYARHGADVCVACAAPVMADRRGLSGGEAAGGDAGVAPRAPRQQRSARLAADAALDEHLTQERDRRSEKAAAQGREDASQGDGVPSDKSAVREALWRTRCALAEGRMRRANPDDLESNGQLWIPRDRHGEGGGREDAPGDS